MEHATQSQGMADRRDFLIDGLAIAYMKYTVRPATKITSDYINICCMFVGFGR